jgi:hypothetical protein
MKTGDLVMWTRPDEPDFGLVIEKLYGRSVFVQWFVDPGSSGIYPKNHPDLELVDERR